MHTDNAHHSYPMVIVSILVTALCWGSYGPLLLWGHQAMGSGRLRPFICVGIAYFLIAIVGPLLIMMLTGMEKGDGLMSGWNFKGTYWSLMGGVAGAIGAFGIILALNYGGHPSLVMPLVFGCAPVVNTFITIGLAKRWDEVHPMYYSGLILVAAGAITVLFFQPGPPKKKGPAAPVKTEKVDKAEASEKDKPSSKPVDEPKKND